MRILPRERWEQWAVVIIAGLFGAMTAWLELALVRLYSYLFPSWLVFPLVSLALLGLGLGGLLARRLIWQPSRWPAVWAAAGAAVSVTMVTVLGALAVASPFLALIVFGVGFTASFVANGVALAVVLQHSATRAGLVYGSYLAAAGGATLIYPLLLISLSWSGATAAAAALPALAVPLLLPAAIGGKRQHADDDPTPPVKRRVATAALLALTPLLLPPLAWMAPDVTSFHPRRVGTPKSLFLSVQLPDINECVVASTWDAYGRTDVTKPPGGEQVRWLYEDGGLPTLLPEADLTLANLDALRQEIEFAPFAVPGPHARVLVTGADMARAALTAALGGATGITALEEHTSRTAAIRRMAPFRGEIAERVGVRLDGRDIRSYLQQSGATFDVIYLARPLPGAAQLGGRVSTAGSLLTVEAFATYLAQLTPAGQLIIHLRDDRELVRAFATAFAVFRGRGETPLQAARHMVALQDAQAAAQQERPVFRPLLLIRKTAYAEEEAQRLVAVLQARGYAPLFLPFQERASPLGAFAFEEVGGLAAVAEALPFDIQPTTDSRPFFFEFAKGAPWRYLLTALGTTIVLVAGILWLREPLPAWGFSPEPGVAEGSDDGTPWRVVLFVALAALAASLAGPPLLLRLASLLGGPGPAGIVGTASFLLGGAAAAFLVQRVRLSATRSTVGWAALTAGLLLVAYREVLPLASSSFAGQPQSTRTGVALALVVPVGFAASVAFPSMVRLAAAAGRATTVPLLWGTTGVCAVLGSALAMIVALQFDLVWCSFVAAALYFAMFLMAGLRVVRFDVQAPVPQPAVSDATESLFRRPPAASDR